LVSAEEEQAIPLDRTADAETDERPVVVRLRERCRGGVLERPLKRIERHQALVLIAEQHIPMPFVAAGLRRRRDDRARCLLVLRLEVLTDDPVLLNRAPREGISLTGVLARDAAAGQVVLEARAIHEDVD